MNDSTRSSARRSTPTSDHSDGNTLAAYRRYYRETEAALAEIEPSWLNQRRRRAIDDLVDTGLPTRRDETWRQSDLEVITSNAFTPPAPREIETVGRDKQAASHWVRSGYPCLTFVDGRFHSLVGLDLSSACGIWVGSLEQALQLHPERMRAHLAEIAATKDNAFLALNTAFFADAAVVLVAQDASFDTALQVVFHNTGSCAQALFNKRLLLFADAGSKLSLLETHCGVNGRLGLDLAVTEMYLGERAKIEHLRVQDEGWETHHLGFIDARLETGASLRATAISLGAHFQRLETRIRLEGAGADVSLGGLYLTDGSRSVDHLTIVDHAAAETTSEQVYQGILKDRSRAVFTGRILVRQDAQKTNAVQSNANLLLSPDSSAHSRPQLEILADDVKCTHGATIGTIDEEALFYARTRGIPLDQARMMLVRAFASRLLERPETALAGDLLEERIGDFLKSCDGQAERG